MKKYEELTFADDFMFCKILTEYPELCKELLGIIIGKEITGFAAPNKQNPIEITPDGRGIRTDVYIEGDDEIYDIEMQTSLPVDLIPRTRYYQGMIDLNSINRGAKFSELKKCCIIFILLKDPFSAGLSKYSFQNYCTENKDISLNDGTEKIFLNASGSDKGISDELKSLLRFILSNQPDDSFTRKLDALVKENILHRKWRNDYMTFAMKLEESKEEGRAEGRQEGDLKGIKGILSMLCSNRLDYDHAKEQADFVYGISGNDFNELYNDYKLSKNDSVIENYLRNRKEK